MIPEHTFIVVNIVKRMSKNEFIYCQKSIELTPLVDQKRFDYLRQTKNNVGKVELGFKHVYQENGITKIKEYLWIDLLSRASFAMIQPIVKHKIESLRRNQQILNYFFLNNKIDLCSRLWFDADSKSVQTIIEENQTLAKAYNIKEEDLHTLNQPSLNNASSSNYQQVELNEQTILN